MTSNEPIPVRPASTVVVVRPARADTLEVLLVRRNDRVAFMAGAYVFPGGRVDAADHATRPSARFLHEPPRFADLSGEGEWPFRVAAARELAEEAGVSVDVDDLIPLAHWVTPAIEIRRYDTRFFLTVMPEGQVARHDDGETTELAWLTPGEALARGLRHEIMLPPPTWTTLRQLERHATLAAALTWARHKVVVRIEPGFIERDGRRVLTLPGDPTYPTVEGWEIPEETRFVLQEGGGWLPTQA